MHSRLAQQDKKTAYNFIHFIGEYMNKILHLFKLSFSIAVFPTISIEIDLFPREILRAYKTIKKKSWTEKSFNCFTFISIYIPTASTQ